jgi:penicillin-binding protein 1A
VRVRVANPSDGGFFYWLAKLYAFAILVVLVAIGAAGLTVYGYFARTTPPAPDLSRYAEDAAAVTRVFAGDGSLLADFAEEWREVVPYEAFPEKLVEAVISAEDHDYFEHGGIYVKGIARALWRNVTAGDWAQGGSTITQQVAKQLLLGAEKTLERKAREAIIARRLEARYTKEQILSVYMNHIFLGSGAYGVQAAARRYFSKSLDALDVGQLALIAGLARSPSRDSPLVNPDNAKRRRDEILERMARYGHLSDAEAAAWQARPLGVASRRDVFLTYSPYYAEHVRRHIREKFGVDGLLRRGLRVETAVQPLTDGVGYENVDFATRKQDRRQGWRGAEAHLEGAARESFIERQKDKYGPDPIDEDRRQLAIVEGVEPSRARVRVGDRLYTLPLRNMSWASRWSKGDATNDQKITSAAEALRPGDVIWIARAPAHVRKFSDWSYDDKLNAHWLAERDAKLGDDEVQLHQVPRVQAAIYTMDHETGYVLAMIGGQDYARSEFNRAVQACRQPGSTYKPIYYSAALDEGYSFDTALNDIPKAEVDPETGEVWLPVNLHGTVDFSVTLEYALVFSKNVPSVDIFSKLGAKHVEKWARRLGFTSPIIADKALALGASCVYPSELSRAFAIFARNGRWVEPVYVRRVLDKAGNVLEDNTVAYGAARPSAAPRAAVPASAHRRRPARRGRRRSPRAGR